MKSRPGISTGILNFSKVSFAVSLMFSFGRVVNDIFCVIPPASHSWMEVHLILSRMDVFPWSTCPATVTIGCRIFVIKGVEEVGF